MFGWRSRSAADFNVKTIQDFMRYRDVTFKSAKRAKEATGGLLRDMYNGVHRVTVEGPSSDDEEDE